MKNIKYIISVILLLLTSLASHSAAPKITINSFNISEISNQNISEKINYFSLQDNIILRPKKLEQLDTWLRSLPSHQKTNTLGDKYVAAFEIYNDTRQPDWFIYPYGSVVQKIEISYFSSNDITESFKTGHTLNNQQDYHYGSKIEILPGQRKTLLLMFESEYFFAPIKILVKPHAQTEQLFKMENVILLISLGICLALGIYNLFIYFSTREVQYLTYAFSVLAYALGWAGVFGVPEYLGLHISEIWLMPAYLIGAIFFYLFNIQFLRLNESSPKVAKTLNISILITIISLPFAFYSQGIGLYLASIATSVGFVLGLYSGIRSWMNGYSPAKYFVFALLLVVLPNMVGNLMNFGVLPGLNVNIYLLGLIGNCLQSLLLAFALAEKVRMLTQQNIELTETLEKTVEIRTAELRQANFQLEQTNSDLIEASNTKSRFLATMSHEIRTPLTSIIGYADGILLGDIDKSEQERVTKVISQNGSHLLNVINDILDISKIEANKLDFESVPTQLFSVLAQIESIVGKRAKDKGLAFHLEYHYPLPAMIITDPTRLKQILFNLTNNAIKFTNQGFIGLSVAILDNKLQIKVKDSGEGVSKQQQEKLFQPFTQADSSINRRFGGTGLGLSISRRLANGLGGNINVQSTPLKGSTFTLDIALSVAQDSTWINNESEIWQSTPTRQVKSSALPNFTGNKVLLADDHPHNRELIAILLKRMNITVTEVENGKQVLETIFYQKFDLILLDIHMPKMDGTEALKQIRLSGNHTPVIALTANNMKHEIEHYIRLGFSEHLAKPISRHHFIEKLSKYLLKQGDINTPIDQTDMLTLIKDYQQDLPTQIDKVKNALEQRDMLAISEVSHRIRGSAGAFGFDLIGRKFADIEHSALQDDEIAVSYELPKVLELTRLFIDLPGVDIPQAIVNHHNSAEQFIKSIFELVKNSESTLKDLNAALENDETNNSLVHLDKLSSIAQSCALTQSLASFTALEKLIKQGQWTQSEYLVLFNRIEHHLALLNTKLPANLLSDL